MDLFVSIARSLVLVVVLIFCCFVPFTNVSGQDGLVIATNLEDWRVWNPVSESFDQPVYAFDVCADYETVLAMCPGTPRADIRTCAEALPIWGSATPDRCHYPIESFYFQRKFDLDLDLEPCQNIQAILTWQADNEARVYINGHYIGYSYLWDIPSRVENVMDYLQHGENEITVEVWNTYSSKCANYAFLSLCLEFKSTLSYDFRLNVEDHSNGVFQMSTYPPYGDEDSPFISNEWYILRRPYGSQQPFVPYSFSRMDWLVMAGDYCYEYRVVRRQMLTEGCYYCHQKRFALCDEQDLQNGDRAAAVDCDFLEEYDWTGLEITAVPETALSSSDVLISPNPVRSNMSVELAGRLGACGFAVESCRIHTVTGQVINLAIRSQEAAKLDIDVSRLSPGLYILELQVGCLSGSLTKKFIVVR